MPKILSICLATLAFAFGLTVAPVEAQPSTHLVCTGEVRGGTYKSVEVPSGESCRLVGAVVTHNLFARGAERVEILDTEVQRNLKVVGTSGLTKIGNEVGCGFDPVVGNNVTVRNSFDVIVCQMSVDNNIQVVGNGGRITVRDNVSGNNISISRNPGIDTLRVLRNTADNHIQVRDNSADRRIVLRGNTPEPVPAKAVASSLSALFATSTSLAAGTTSLWKSGDRFEGGFGGTYSPFAATNHFNIHWDENIDGDSNKAKIVADVQAGDLATDACVQVVLDWEGTNDSHEDTRIIRNCDRNSTKSVDITDDVRKYLLTGASVNGVDGIGRLQVGIYSQSDQTVTTGRCLRGGDFEIVDGDCSDGWNPWGPNNMGNSKWVRKDNGTNWYWDGGNVFDPDA